VSVLPPGTALPSPSPKPVRRREREVRLVQRLLRPGQAIPVWNWTPMHPGALQTAAATVPKHQQLVLQRQRLLCQGLFLGPPAQVHPSKPMDGRRGWHLLHASVPSRPLRATDGTVPTVCHSVFYLLHVRDSDVLYPVLGLRALRLLREALHDGAAVHPARSLHTRELQVLQRCRGLRRHSFHVLQRPDHGFANVPLGGSSTAHRHRHPAAAAATTTRAGHRSAVHCVPTFCSPAHHRARATAVRLPAVRNSGDIVSHLRVPMPGLRC